MAQTKTVTYRSGLWNGVRTTDEPLDDEAASVLHAAVNGYFPDPDTGSGFYARPAFTLDRALSGGSTTQALFSIVLSDGTPYNFTINDGVVSRSTTVGGALTTVTPTGVTISSGASAIYVLPLIDSFVVNDGVNIPWLATNLTASPITGTPIDYQTASVLLSRGSTDTRVASAAFTYLLAGVNYSKTAVAAGTALPAGTIPTNTWGVYRVSVNTAGTIALTAGAANYTTGYATEPLAIAALPAVPAGQWNVGHFTVQTEVGSTFVATTDALQGGASGNPANATNYYAGSAPPWQAFGQPTLYTGAVFFILATVEGSATNARTTIAWAEPNEPLVGYQQTDYDNAWTLTQTGTDPLYAIQGTNDALYYWRQFSIGAVAGAPGVNFQGTATHDVVAGNVGTVFPRTVVPYLGMIYFADAMSRPWRFAVGGAPEPIYRQLRGALSDSIPSGPLWGIVEPNLNVYLVRSIACASSGKTFAFDAPTGIFIGVWQVTGADLGLQTVGLHRDADRSPRLVTSEESGALSVNLWSMGTVAEADFEDSGAAQAVSVTTLWLGYDAQDTMNARMARVLQAAATPTVTLTVNPVAGATYTASRAPAGVAQANTGRIVYPLNSPVGRGVRLTAAPTTLATQWKCWRLEVDCADAGVATVEDY